MNVSICIVTLNAWRLLKKCIDSIPSAMGNLNYEVIIVDNHSKDNTIRMLEHYYPQFTLIKNRINKGYTAPMNQALKRAKGSYLLQLNPDT
ncbi:MAG: glycosyl transferase, partial [Candidatus Marinimicrobia bacterium]|nr:glycosyl transferase [Candidatus Neomarinimicrobiota bacterium]